MPVMNNGQWNEKVWKRPIGEYLYWLNDMMLQERIIFKDGVCEKCGKK
jgi:hypothetical protein